MKNSVAAAPQKHTLARQPLPLVRSWRRAIAQAAAPFWHRFAPHDLAVADERLHARLLACIADVDRACAAESREQLAATGAALVETWKEAVAFMQARHRADDAPRQGTHPDWRVQLAKLERWPGTPSVSSAGTAPGLALSFYSGHLGTLDG